MRLKNENECFQAIDKWKEDSAESQKRNLRQAIEKMELDLMYYEDKGSDKIAIKLSRCLEILTKKLSEIGPN